MVREPAPHDPDILEAAGWAECLEQASSGVVPFTGGGLRVSLTPAMTVIDVDGHLPPAPLAIAAAKAVAATIRLFNLTGSIGIDFPTLANKEERLAATEAFDAILPLPYERTAMNGFGFMQVIRPRRRASLCELLQYGRCPAAARALLRTAQRSKITGSVALTAHPDVIAILRAEPGWIAILAKQLGGETILRPDARLAMNAGHVAAA
jgi:Ribonuclease G/E